MLFFLSSPATRKATILIWWGLCLVHDQCSITMCGREGQERAGKKGEEGERKENLKPRILCIVVWAGLYVAERGGHIRFL